MNKSSPGSSSRNTYQTGWIRELSRDGGEWSAFKLCRRERDPDTPGERVECSKMLPRYRLERR